MSIQQLLGRIMDKVPRVSVGSDFRHIQIAKWHHKYLMTMYIHVYAWTYVCVYKCMNVCMYVCFKRVSHQFKFYASP